MSDRVHCVALFDLYFQAILFAECYMLIYCIGILANYIWFNRGFGIVETAIGWI